MNLTNAYQYRYAVDNGPPVKVIHTKPAEEGAEPAYKHFCEECIFLGRVVLQADGSGYDTADLYFCPRAFLTKPTVLARYSSVPSAYVSGIPIAADYLSEGNHDHPLAVALLLALGRGLADPNDPTKRL